MPRASKSQKVYFSTLLYIVAGLLIATGFMSFLFIEAINVSLGLIVIGIILLPVVSTIAQKTK